jgi:hypothetical protein
VAPVRSTGRSRCLQFGKLLVKTISHLNNSRGHGDDVAFPFSEEFGFGQDESHL